MSKGLWKTKLGCRLCNGTGTIENTSYPNVIQLSSRVCPRCKGKRSAVKTEGDSK